MRCADISVNSRSGSGVDSATMQAPSRKSASRETEARASTQTSGARVFVMTADRSLRVFDADPLREASSAPIPWSEAMRTLGASDDGRRVALGGAQGLVVVFSVAASEKPRVVGHLPGPVACLAFAHAGRALVAASGRRVDVLDTDTGRSFTLFTAPAPVVDCQRSPDEDRFSFVDADGTAWVRALDLSDVADGFIPPETGLPGSDPAIATWKGLPTGLAGR